MLTYDEKLRETQPAVLYVDDDLPNLHAFRRCFKKDFRVITCLSAAEALEVLESEEVGVVVSDHCTTEMSSVELLERISARFPNVTRVVLTAPSERKLLRTAIQKGHVHDLVVRPWQPSELRQRLRDGQASYCQRAAAARMSAPVRDDEPTLVARETDGEIVGLDGGLVTIAAILARVARSDSTVMLRGESGTGKELIARELHRLSGRAAGPFIRTNCAAFSEGVLESELFGHEVGAFTGALKMRIGRFEQAGGGTLFLDEIGDIGAGLQAKLLRVLQEREFERVGGNRTIRVDIRLIAATHRKLETMVRRGEFREDLYHRLNVVPLWVPPLRARPQDITALAKYFVAQLARELGKSLTMSGTALDALQRYSWPGNVRELRNVIERAAVLAEPIAVLEPEDLVFDFAREPSSLPSTSVVPALLLDGAPSAVAVAGASESIFDEIANREAERIRDALRRAGGSRTRAARLLGVPRTTLNARIRRLGIA